MTSAAMMVAGVALITALLALAFGRSLSKKRYVLTSIAFGLVLPLLTSLVAFWRLKQMPTDPPPVDAGAMLVLATAVTVGMMLPITLVTSFLTLLLFKKGRH